MSTWQLDMHSQNWIHKFPHNLRANSSARCSGILICLRIHCWWRTQHNTTCIHSACMRYECCACEHVSAVQIFMNTFKLDGICYRLNSITFITHIIIVTLNKRKLKRVSGTQSIVPCTSWVQYKFTLRRISQYSDSDFLNSVSSRSSICKHHKAIAVD